MKAGPEQDVHLEEWWRALGTSAGYEALRQLFEYLYDDLYTYAVRLLADREEAEDAIQEMFANLWQYRKTLDYTAPARPYLLRSVRNHCLRIARKREKTEAQGPVAAQRMFYPGEVLLNDQQDEMRRHVTRMLNALSPRQKEILYLKYYEDLNYREIAEILHIRYQSVLNHAHKATRQLRLALGTHRERKTMGKKLPA